MKEILKKIASALLFAGAAAVTVILTVICIAWFDDGFIYDYGPIIASVLVTVEVVYVLIALVFLLNGSQTVYKFMLTGLLLAALILIVCFVLQVTGFLDKIDSVEALQEFIDSRGSFWAPLIFIALQMLQVFLLPLPGVITVGAGVLLFGVWETCLYSYIGILLGSLIGFAVGRVIGYRAAAWLVGRESLDSWLEKVKGKDRRLLTVMFLLPIFPDDILCFVAGLSTARKRRATQIKKRRAALRTPAARQKRMKRQRKRGAPHARATFPLPAARARHPKNNRKRSAMRPDIPAAFA